MTKAVLDANVKQKVDPISARPESQPEHHTEAGFYMKPLPNSQNSLAAARRTSYRVMANVLNDMQFEYDGSVHYRQKNGIIQPDRAL